MKLRRHFEKPSGASGSRGAAEAVRRARKLERKRIEHGEELLELRLYALPRQAGRGRERVHPPCPSGPTPLRSNWTNAYGQLAMFTPDQNRQQAVSSTASARAFWPARSPLVLACPPPVPPPTNWASPARPSSSPTSCLASSRGYVRARTGSGHLRSALTFPDAAPAPGSRRRPPPPAPPLQARPAHPHRRRARLRPPHASPRSAPCRPEGIPAPPTHSRVKPWRPLRR